MSNNVPQPPERSPLDQLAEEAYLNRRVRESNEEAKKDPSSIAQQERTEYAFRKWLRQLRDQRNGY